MQRKIKILYVCHGNICRSPMAEFVFRDMVEKAGLSAEISVASAATSTDEIWNGIGNPVHHGTRNKLNEVGISCAGKRAVQMTKQDAAEYDYLIGMDANNIRNMKRIAGDKYETKMKRLLDFTDNPRDIADPWYTGDFDKTYEDVVCGCEALLRYLTAGHSLHSC